MVEFIVIKASLKLSTHSQSVSQYYVPVLGWVIPQMVTIIPHFQYTAMCVVDWLTVQTLQYFWFWNEDMREMFLIMPSWLTHLLCVSSLLAAPPDILRPWQPSLWPVPRAGRVSSQWFVWGPVCNFTHEWHSSIHSLFKSLDIRLNIRLESLTVKS